MPPVQTGGREGEKEHEVFSSSLCNKLLYFLGSAEGGAQEELSKGS